jgi:type II secretory ATPase GspE/PulE/Tfp pilus assembly ATPase PilB-like protein
VDDIKGEITIRYQELNQLPDKAEKTEKAPRRKSPVQKVEELEAVDTENHLDEEELEYETERFEEIARQASGSSVINMVSTILEGAVNSGATDIHLDPQDPETRVRYRIDGVLHDIMSIPKKLETAVVSRQNSRGSGYHG